MTTTGLDGERRYPEGDAPSGETRTGETRPDEVASGSATRRLGRFLCAPVTGRTWAEFLYILIGLPLAVLGFAHAVVTLAAGIGLAVTFLGLPVIALGVWGASGIAGVHRRLARRLLGEHVAEPVGPAPAAGFLVWLQSRLRDANGWRAMAYLALKLPLALLTFGVAGLLWVYALFGSTYALWRPFVPGQVDSAGVVRHGVQLTGDQYVDAAPEILTLTAAGIVLLLATPWIVRGLLLLDRLLLRHLVGPAGLSERVRDLERARARAVDGSAATLRRIERDLHDGAQARLVALAMKLGMAKDELEGAGAGGSGAGGSGAGGSGAGGRGGDEAVARARALVDAAHRNAKEALAELRDLARGIHPPVLDSGLDSAIATLSASIPVQVEQRIDLADRPSPAIETILYFCAAELLANVAKHSGATLALIDVRHRGGVVRLRVADDGRGGARVGTGEPGDGGGSGLAGLVDRLRPVEGRLDITSPAGGPTVITVDLPSRV
jgi:signal transduction histidine kinase